MGGKPTIACVLLDDAFAPIPDLPSLAAERGGSTQSGPSGTSWTGLADSVDLQRSTSAQADFSSTLLQWD